MKKFLLALLLVCNTAYAEPKWLLFNSSYGANINILEYVDLNSITRVGTSIHVEMKMRYISSTEDKWLFSRREVDCAARIARPLFGSAWDMNTKQWVDRLRYDNPQDWFRIETDTASKHYLYNTLICKK